MYHYFSEALKKEQQQMKQLAINNKSKLKDVQSKPQSKQIIPQKQEILKIVQKENLQDRPIKVEQPKQKSQIETPIQPKQTVMEEQPKDDIKLFGCPQGCGRNFNEKALQKHIKICKKVFQDAREPFDSKAQREAEGLDEIAMQMTKPKQKPKKQTNKASWREKSEALKVIIQTAKNPNVQLTAEQQELVKNANNLDLIQCDYCGRKFNEKAAEKHIPFCQKQKKNKK